MKQISVDINVTGDVIDSEIIGVKFANSQSHRTIKDRFFARVFFEYLLLPTFSEIGARLDRTVWKWQKRGIREFDLDKRGLMYLWMSILQEKYQFPEPSTFSMHDGTKRLWVQQNGNHVKNPGDQPEKLNEGDWVLLKNIQITPYVNRSPGKFFLGGWEFHNGHIEESDSRYVVSNTMWSWEDYAVKTMGIGDVRFGEINGFYLLQCGSRISHDPGVMSSAQDGSHSAGGASISALGFPLLVDYKLYNQLQTHISEYGAVFVDKLHAQVHRIGDDVHLAWAPKVPKMCLVAIDRKAISEPMQPFPMYSAVWTVAANHSLSEFHYCTWGFTTGIERFQNSIENAVRVIDKAISERGLHPIFEFDAQANWFGESTMFTPGNMIDLSTKILSSPEGTRLATLAYYASMFESRVDRAFKDETYRKSSQIAEVVGENVQDTLDILCKGEGYLNLSDFESAAVCFEKAVELMPNFAYSWYLLGIAYANLGNEDKFIMAWKRALAEKPHYRVKDHIEKVLNETSTPHESDG